MYFNDHSPAHFHAEYSGDEAVIGIEEPSVLGGRLPPRARGLVIEWAQLRRAELWEAWRRVQRLELPDNIAPLD